MRTSFHHQPEAQHPKFFSYQQAAGRLPHLCQSLPYAPQQISPLFDHLVGAGEHGWRHGKAASLTDVALLRPGPRSYLRVLRPPRRARTAHVVPLRPVLSGEVVDQSDNDREKRHDALLVLHLPVGRAPAQAGSGVYGCRLAKRFRMRAAAPICAFLPIPCSGWPMACQTRDAGQLARRRGDTPPGSTQ